MNEREREVQMPQTCDRFCRDNQQDMGSSHDLEDGQHHSPGPVWCGRKHCMCTSYGQEQAPVKGYRQTNHETQASRRHRENVPWHIRLNRIRAEWHAWLAGGNALTQLLITCLGEFLGNFFVTLPLSLAIAEGFMLAGGHIDSNNFGTIALAVAIGVGFSVISFVRITGTTLHSSVTIVMALFGRVAWWRVPFQLLSQIMGSYVAELLASVVYWDMLSQIRQDILHGHNDKRDLHVLGFSTIFSTLKQLGRSHQYVFLAEFLSAFLAAIVICSCFDRTNPLSSLRMAGPTIGAFYAVHILAFVPASALGNPANDIGSRLACASLLGKQEKCFMGALSLNAAFTPTLGMFLGFLVFFIFVAKPADQFHPRKAPGPADDPHKPQRALKRAMLRPFQYRTRRGGASTHPHRKVVSFGHKVDDSTRGSMILLEEGEAIKAHVAPHTSSSDKPDDTDPCRPAYESTEPHSGEQEHPSIEQLSVASADWLIRSDSNSSSLFHDHRVRRPAPRPMAERHDLTPIGSIYSSGSPPTYRDLQRGEWVRQETVLATFDE